MESEDIRTCESCTKTRPVLVGSLPGIPLSVARCIDCVLGDVIPLWVAVHVTADIGGMDNAADWWRETVSDTLKALQVTPQVFDEMLAEHLVGLSQQP